MALHTFGTAIPHCIDAPTAQKAHISNFCYERYSGTTCLQNVVTALLNLSDCSSSAT